ncbi:type VI secretion system protein TssA [Vibrio viridaestus]|uniref:Type VI secretion system protein TssA n=1 Tax=Vibrio viridaestus TaxID=2487322 RepID=A0A3N9U5T6_9VIBR|nr:type VI secretion system protein TssA [Vibrio viridaestus]RQW65082.1 type VI secretion system protein TssA [Vibrio viridaestus]
MELAQYRELIAQPIPGESQVGSKLLDDPVFEYVEDQMMKVGSLSHDTIEWQDVENKTLELLSTKSKDIKLLTYLIQCLYNQLSPARFNLSMILIGEFVDHYWEEAFPAPGPKGKVPRKRLLAQIGQRVKDAYEKVDLNRFVDDREKELDQASEVLANAVEKRALESDELSSVIRNIRSHLSQAEQRRKLAESQKEQQQQNVQSTAGGSGVESGAQSSSSVSSIAIDTSNEKATKTTLLKVAEVLSDQHNGGGLSIRVRRYAVWSSINSVPDHNPQGETLLRPMQQDRIKDYQDMMHSPDLSLWKKVEQSLTMAPYWFEGHKMSYEIALALGHKDWCEAIRDETERFLQKLPQLKDLSFKGGVPFVPDEVSEWLVETAPSAGQSGGSGQGWGDIRKQVTKLAEDKGMNEALSMVNNGLENEIEPRNQWYWRLMSADLMKAQGFEAMAKESYQTLYKQALSMNVSDWEPSIIQQLEKYTASE